MRFISVGNSMYQRAVVRVEGDHCRLAGEHIAHSNVFFPIPRKGTKVVLLSRSFIEPGSDYGEFEFEVADITYRFQLLLCYSILASVALLRFVLAIRQIWRHQP